MAIATVHHHAPEDSPQRAYSLQGKQYDKQQQTDKCAHQHDHTPDQDCGICFLIHHNNPINLSSCATDFALVYRATLPKLKTPYLLPLQQDHQLSRPWLRGPPTC